MSSGHAGYIGTAVAQSSQPRSTPYTRNQPQSDKCGIPECERPCYVGEGIVHQFCGRTHAKLAKDQGLIPSLQKPHGVCQQCALPGCTRPRYLNPDSGLVEDYCGVYHARQGRHHRNAMVIPSQKQCSLPGCTRTVHVRDCGKEEDFCTRTHASLAKQRGLEANQEEGIERTYSGKGWRMGLLQKTHPSYESVKQQFLEQWKKPMPPTPTVQRIFKIHNRVEAIDKFKALEQSLGNVKRRFHGTKAHCGLGVRLNNAACMQANCNACNICTNGFEVRGEHFSRYGDGVYTSATSGKSNDYAGNDNNAYGKTFRCMFLCKVAAGKTFKTQVGRLPADQCPPAGYDSVVGDVGVSLNYDELCVYNADSVLPAYWIVYQLN